MGFNLEYYQDKRNKKANDFAKYKHKTLQEFIGLAVEFAQEQSRYQQDIADITNIIKENTPMENEEVVTEQVIDEDGAVEETVAPAADEVAVEETPATEEAPAA